MNERQAKDVSAFDAKTRLPELLRATERGQRYLIRRRGKPVARLLPPEEAGNKLADLVADLAAIRKRVRGKVDVLKLIEEGRRH